MHISKIDTQTRRQNYYNKNNQNVSFNAFPRFYMFERKSYLRKAAAYELKEDLINYINYYFSRKAVRKAHIDNNMARNEMLFDFARKLQMDEASGLVSNDKTPEIIGKIAERLNPKNEAQKLLLQDHNFSTTDFESLIKLVEKKENAKLTENLLGLRDEKNAKLNLSKKLKSILELDKAKQLNSQFDDFRSYIILHINEEDFVQKLSAELGALELSFSPVKLDRIVDAKIKKLRSPLLDNFSAEFLANSNAKVVNFLSDGYSAQVLNAMDRMPEEDLKFFEYLIKTSDANNVDARLNILRKYISHLNKKENFGDFKILFDRMEKDENLKRFISTWSEIEKTSSMPTVKELLFYVDKFGSKILANDTKNFANILRQNSSSNPDSVVEVLAKNLRNKYYITDETLDREKIAEKYSGNKYAQIKGRIKRAIKYGLLQRFSGEALPVRKLNDVKFEDYELTSIKTKPVLKLVAEGSELPTYKTVPNTVNPTTFNYKVTKELPSSIPTEPPTNVLTFVEEVPQKPEIIEQPSTPKKIVRAYKPKDPKISARKLKLVNDAQEIIKLRMKSAKQIEEQAHDYSITATKMRNKYLNELFDYVADIRKAESKRGKKHHSVSNYDVLELYQKIKGYNEKEFRKMLRARTPEGERMYSFDEINKMLDDSMVEHFRILREQQAAAKEARRLKKMPPAATI